MPDVQQAISVGPMAPNVWPVEIIVIAHRHDPFVTTVVLLRSVLPVLLMGIVAKMHHNVSPEVVVYVTRAITMDVR